MNIRPVVRLALPCDKAAVEALLRAGFGDEEGFLHAFFAHLWPQRLVLLSMAGRTPAAMAALIPCRVMPEGRGAHYLYALTTLPAFRGQGHARGLLRAAEARCGSVFLHAENAGLQGFYARQGWRYGLYALKTRLPAAAGPLPARATADAYFARRARILAAQPHILWQGAACDFAHDLLLDAGGGLYAAPDALLAVTERQNDTLYLGEALGAGAFAAAQALAHALGCREALIDTPCSSRAAGALPLGQYVGPPLAENLRLGFDFH